MKRMLTMLPLLLVSSLSLAQIPALPDDAQTLVDAVMPQVI